jgi:hypothetical protein
VFFVPEAFLLVGKKSAGLWCATPQMSHDCKSTELSYVQTEHRHTSATRLASSVWPAATCCCCCCSTACVLRDSEMNKLGHQGIIIKLGVHSPSQQEEDMDDDDNNKGSQSSMSQSECT